MHLHYFTFGQLQENTYILWDETKQCVIIDPGNYNTTENMILLDFILSNQLTPVQLLLTHAHIDHINGNAFIFKQFNLLPIMHFDDLYFIQNHLKTAKMYQLQVTQSPLPTKFINNTDNITFGNTILKILHTPGHSPGSISFYNETENILISGDVLFQNSIGRTDLPLSKHEDLVNSIQNKLYALPNNTKVYSGHGPYTTIGYEKKHNPFVRG